MMPVPRRRASNLGHGVTGGGPRAGLHTCATGCGGRVTVTSGGGGQRALTSYGPRAALTVSGTRVTRRALGISSVFLQGTRSSAAPVVPKTGLTQSGLGWSLVDYRDKVQALEQLNLELEQQIRSVLQQRSNSATSWEPLRDTWEQLYRQVSEWILSNARLMLQSENIQNNADDFKDRLDSLCPWRRDLEEEIEALHKVVDEASETQGELQHRYDDLWAELQQLQLHHQQDVCGLYSQMSPQDLNELHYTQTGLDQVLDHIRTQWERVCEQNRLKSHQETKEPALALSPDQEKIEGLKTEVQETSNKLQSLQAQTESLRALKRGLDASLSDARHWQEVEVHNLGSVVSRLESELSQVRTESETQRRDLETLISNKERLEQEVHLYQMLLQGEEARYQGEEAQDRDQDKNQNQDQDQQPDRKHEPLLQVLEPGGSVPHSELRTGPQAGPRTEPRTGSQTGSQTGPQTC